MSDKPSMRFSSSLAIIKREVLACFWIPFWLRVGNIAVLHRNSSTAAHSAKRALCISAILILPSLHAFSDEAFHEAQSSFRFRSIPEFMLIRIYPNGVITGSTASLWNTNQGDSHEESFVLGRVLKEGRLKLSFYSSSSYESARREVTDEAISKCGILSDTGCYPDLLLKKVAAMGIHPIQASIFRYLASTREWVAEVTDSKVKYSRFALEKNHDLGSVEAAVLGSGIPRHYVSDQFRPSPVDDLFGPEIVQVVAGLPPSEQINFKTIYCDKIATGLTDVLRHGGNWEVDVLPEKSKVFQLRLKSHSSKQFFYKDGYWWKAFAEVSFSGDDDHGTCSGAVVYLYDTVVCGGPANKDPDATGRHKCFHRIDSDSIAEVELRDRLTDVLTRAYGAAPAE